MNILWKLANIWGFIKKRQSLVAGFLKIDLASLVLEGVSLRSLHEELNAILNEAAEALKAVGLYSVRRLA